MDVIQTGKGNLIQPPDLNAFREWNRHKSKVLSDKRMTEAEATMSDPIAGKPSPSRGTTNAALLSSSTSLPLQDT